ncbi:MAG: TRC40/GET3/ArsA family transport-energizing ATPase [Flavobacteriales bacterium]|nr:TRC40/GET3/ArsA family transport-energizing ATPase [Flavobacteriales bacterium]
MRILLFTGKGGVGKTTVAAASALKCAQQGYKTLIISTDPAHSLADAIDQELGPEPVKITENLWGQEIDVYYSMKMHWGNLREMMKAVFRFKGGDNIMAEEMSVIPGMEEGAAFMWIEKYYTEKAYDVIVIDSAPTGETLTLLGLPQVTKSWLTRAIPGQKFAIKTLGKVVRKTTGIPLDHGYAELELLFDKLEKVQKVFSDPSVCSIRLVANPERMVIQEAKRAYTYLQLYGYNVDAVIVNRIIPKQSSKSFFANYFESQEKYLQEIEETFAPLPIMKVGHQGQEVFGLELLNKIGDSVYNGDDPATVYFNESPINIIEQEDGFLIKLRIPFIGDQDFTLNKFGDELIVDLGSRRRNVFLPRFSNFLELDSHLYEEPWLAVKLVKR